MKNKMRTLMCAVGFAWTISPAAALEWPMKVAEKGCQFEWEGTNGYQELAISQGVSTFPTILFSREDWGSGTHPFIPFCGSSCLSDSGRNALHALFPLKAGKQVQFSDGREKITMRVAKRERVPPLNHRAFLVETTSSHGLNIQSWWAPEVGWIVAYKDNQFYKVVTSANCPKGLG